MRRLVYLASAYQDLLDIQRYIANESGHLSVANRFAGRIRQRCERLASLPGVLGRSRPELRADIRSLPFQAYIIFFRYTPDTVEIVNILHGHRDLEAFFNPAP